VLYLEGPGDRALVVSGVKNGLIPADRTRVTGSVHLRGIVIAGVLAAIALALGFFTLAMNQTASQAAPKTIIPLHLRHHATAAPKTVQPGKGAPKVKPKPKPDPNYTAAVQAGLPRSVARALAKHPVVVVQLTSKADPVAQLAAGEAKAGAADANAGYVAVNVDGNGGDVEVLTRALGKLPTAPAALIYVRPAKLFTTLPNFNDRTVVEQALVTAKASGTTPASGPSTTPATPVEPAAAAPVSS
jgi:hypothetical protein